MKSIYTFVIFLNLIGSVVAAVPVKEIDSLKKKTPLVKGQLQTTDTASINRLNSLADDYYESQPDSSVFYANLAISAANKIKYYKGAADGYVQLGAVNSFKGNYTLATKNYKTALNLSERVNNQFGISEAYMGLGRVEDFLGNYASAINWFQKALIIRKKLNKAIDIANCYAIIGITYDNKGDLSTALDYYFKSLMIDLKVNDQLAAADNYNNIGVVMQHLALWPKAMAYFADANKIWLKLHDKQGISTCYLNMGEVMAALNKQDTAIKYYRRALALFNQLGDQEGISLAYYDIGLYHYKASRPDSALYYLNLCRTSAAKNSIKYNLAYAYEGLAMVYNTEKQYQQGYNYALLAQQLANRLNSLNVKADASLQVSNALAGLGRFEESLIQHRLYTNLIDSLKKNESLQKFTSYSIAIDFENNLKKSERKEAILNKKIADQRITNIVYGIVIVIVSIMLVTYYNAKRKQIKANTLLADKNKEVLLQANELNELNTLKDRLISILAHDLRAPLSTLRGMFYLLTEKDITYAEFIKMVPTVFGKLEHTSDFLDTLLFWINSQVDNTAEKTTSFCLCDIVKIELELLESQFNNKNITPINTVGKGNTVLADPNSIRIVIHNFLTNSIKFSHQNSTIKISAEKRQGKIDFCITDNGVGMSEEQLRNLFKKKVESQHGTMNESGTGMGLIFCKDLIEKYNGKVWAKSKPGEGTELGFTLSAANTDVNAAGNAVISV